MPAHDCGRSTKSKFRLLYLGTDLKLIVALRQALTEPDYRLVVCSDRESAILFLKSKIQYDLLLIDLEWRDTEGFELARLATPYAIANECRSFWWQQRNWVVN